MWFPFRKKKETVPALLPGQWFFVPLGNPGSEYVCTRHNLGRLMLQRWMEHNSLESKAIHSFYYGTLYSLSESLVALVPSTYMNLSGKAVVDAVKVGFPIERMVVVYDDKDLLLGAGRLSKNGGAAGHRGLQNIIDELGTDNFIRLRLGLSPFQRPLHEWVLGEWAAEEWELIANMDAPFSRFMSMLAENPTITDLQGHVNASVFWQNNA